MMKWVWTQGQKGWRTPSILMLMLLLVASNSVVFYNAWLHHPLVGYDAHDHVAYLLTVANGRLPTAHDTYEFFSPPLPYALPAAALGLGWLSPYQAMRFALLLNGLLAIGTTVTLVAVARQLNLRHRWLPLALLSLLPVYYKTNAFIRGEPYVLFFGLLIIYVLLKPPPSTESQHLRRAAGLGVLLGLGILSRQWAFFFVPVVVLHAVLTSRQQQQASPSPRRYRLGLVAQWQPLLLRTNGITAVIALLVGGWFYLYLYHSYGTLTAFNRTPASSFALTNQPAHFYTGLGDGYLFTDPVRPRFANQLLPKFYSELWGDHEAYFVVVGRDGRNGRYLPGWKLEKEIEQPWLQTNRVEMGTYLGWVNRVALLPTAVLLLGFLFGLQQTAVWLPHLRWQAPPAAVILWLTTAVSIAGYLWFLILYPNLEKGDTIKATYLLHTFPLLALLAASALERLPKWGQWVVWVGLGGTAVYLTPLFFTHYPV